MSTFEPTVSLPHHLASRACQHEGKALQVEDEGYLGNGC
jgi:hypothetical protein